MNPIRKFTFLNYFVCFVAFVLEIIFAYDLRPLENAIFIFLIIWGSLPIITLMLFILKTPPIKYSVHRSLFQTLVVVSVGLVLKINSIYIHPDPRGAIALVTIPIIQIIVALFIGLIIKLATQRQFRTLNDQDGEYQSD